ncbi:MAG: PTS transporter subunit EIIC [Anaerococcus sp.]|nr:PTS transporter subunit EIIC [Anaerococcus sp.]
MKLDKLDKILSPIADTLSKNKVLAAIRDGFLVTTPIVIIGSLFLLIANFPIDGYADFMAGIFGQGWSVYLERVTAIAFDCVALLASFSIGYCYAREKGLDNRISAAAVALVSFLIVTPQNHPDYLADGERAFSGFSFAHLGTAGIFLSMIVAIISVSIFAFAVNKKLVIKLPEGVPPAVMDSFAALIPAAFSMIFFFIINIIIANTSYNYLHNLIYEVLQAPLVGLGKFALFEVIYQFLSTLFWFFGINGPAVTNTIFSPIHKALTLENYEAAKAGLEMTNVFTAGFSDFFCNFGGGGSTLGLVIMMAFLAKSNRMKMLGRLSLPAGIFGINEPIIFGLPIVLNPIMLIPFILSPVVNTIIAYLATIIGFIPVTSGIQLPWTMPIGFSGYLITGSLSAVILQLGLLVLNMAIYYPFMKLLDKKYLEEENEKVDEVDELDELSFDDLSLD